jgi:tetraprenyl-beta-curcumene synthase
VVARALALANARYWSTVAPVVRVELARWRARAEAIADPRLRALALAKLDGERFNAEAGAMLATHAPRAHRADAVRAIVALQVLFDLLDGLTEQRLADPLGDGERLFAPFLDALRPGCATAPHADALPGALAPRGEQPAGAAGGYLLELSDAARAALARLPARAAVIDLAQASACRAAQAQVRMHAAPALGAGQLREWAQAQARGTGLGWRELLAGAASSVLVVHALVVAAARPDATTVQAARLADAYLSICVLLTLLDSLVDEQRDERAGRAGYVSLYEDRELLAQALDETAARALAQARTLPDARHHVLMLTGVVAYYASTPAARAERARPLVARVQRALPLVAPTLVFMRAWRLTRGARARARGRSNHTASVY